MQKPRIRPTFSVHLAPGADEAMVELRERLRGTDYEDCTRSKGRCAYFFVDEEERRVWSPHLSIQVEPKAEGSLLRGRFGPHPELWTLFMFLYTAVGFLATIGLMLGFVQWQSGMDPWGLWGVGLGVPGLAVLKDRISASISKPVQKRAYNNTDTRPRSTLVMRSFSMVYIRYILTFQRVLTVIR